MPLFIAAHYATNHVIFFLTCNSKEPELDRQALAEGDKDKMEIM